MKAGTITPEERLLIKQKTAKPMLWIAIVSIVMLFAGLTSGYIVRQAQGDWLVFEVPGTFFGSTALIILSSITMWLSGRAMRSGNQTQAVMALGITLFLGIGFSIFQFFGWGQLTEAGIYFTGRGSNVSGSFFYAITALHMAHLVGGLIALIVTLINTAGGKYSAENHLGLQLCAIYWHFLDILWVYLLLFLVFIR